MPQLLLAFENGEVDGVPATNWDTLKSTRQHWFRCGSANVILQYGAKRHGELPTSRWCTKSSSARTTARRWLYSRRWR